MRDQTSLKAVQYFQVSFISTGSLTFFTHAQEPIHPIVYSLIYLITHSLAYPYICSFAHSLARRIVHSLV